MATLTAAKSVNKLLPWEIAAFLFIGTFGASLHYIFELSEFWRPIGWLGAVNESTWEHLKMVFWPALIFALLEYTYVREQARNYVFAKAAGIVVMMAIIIASWYIYTPITGNINWLNIALFYIALATGSLLSYYLLTRPSLAPRYHQLGLATLLLLAIAFSVFTYYPPRFSLFEHYDLQDTGEYGILDDYEAIRVFGRQ